MSQASTHVLIIEARFYDDISDALVEGTLAALDKAGVTYQRVAVPGALEIPAAISFAVAAQGKALPKIDGFIALGCVIRGETTHYDIVANESARALQELSIRHNLAIGNGIITVENEDQAWARAKKSELNKGGGAAEACLKLIELKRKWQLA